MGLIFRLTPLQQSFGAITNIKHNLRKGILEFNQSKVNQNIAKHHTIVLCIDRVPYFCNKLETYF